MTDWKRLGRNNKNRGRSFERRVAAFLGFTRVPYSGGSGEWGSGDVVDGFYSRKGNWFCECKTQPPPNISVREKWIARIEDAKEEFISQNRNPVIIVGRTGMPVTESMVFFPQRSWLFLTRYVPEIDHNIILNTKTMSSGRGFCVRSIWLLPTLDIARVNVTLKDGTFRTWRMMSLSRFKDLIDTHHLANFERKEGEDG